MATLPWHPSIGPDIAVPSTGHFNTRGFFSNRNIDIEAPYARCCMSLFPSWALWCKDGGVVAPTFINQCSKVHFSSQSHSSSQTPNLWRNLIFYNLGLSNQNSLNFLYPSKYQITKNLDHTTTIIPIFFDIELWAKLKKSLGKLFKVQNLALFYSSNYNPPYLTLLSLSIGLHK